MTTQFKSALAYSSTNNITRFRRQREADNLTLTFQREQEPRWTRCSTYAQRDCTRGLDEFATLWRELYRVDKVMGHLIDQQSLARPMKALRSEDEDIHAMTRSPRYESLTNEEAELGWESGGTAA